MMEYKSILFPTEEKREVIDYQEVLKDINADQIISSITGGYEEYKLDEFFLMPLSNVADAEYRHDVMRDLEKPEITQGFIMFSEKMKQSRRTFSRITSVDYDKQNERSFLESARLYCEAVDDLSRLFIYNEVQSSGLSDFIRFLLTYWKSQDFKNLSAQVGTLLEDLKLVHYTLLIDGSHVTVQKFCDEANFSEEIRRFFEKFRQQDKKKFTYKTNIGDMNHIDERIFSCVSKLYPEIFKKLQVFYRDNQGFYHNGILQFEQEIQFYLAYRKYMNRFLDSELSFCFPTLSTNDKQVFCEDSFDMALASKLFSEGKKVVTNGFSLSGKERIIIVTGPNQGGKTTFARMYGQLHYFASLGLPVAGKIAKLFLPDRIYTHFENKEKQVTLNGKLQDDIIRIHDILNRATSNSIIVINELFSSTTLEDAVNVAEKIIDTITQRDILCIYITFLEELSTYNENTISMVSTVSRYDRQTRTYKILRLPADGKAYALSVAQKYRLTYDDIRERVKS